MVGSENQLPNYTKCMYKGLILFIFSLLKLTCNCVKIKSENFLMAHNCHFMLASRTVILTYLKY